MGYKQQKEKWLNEHPEAKPEEAWEAGYLTCVENWTKKRR